RARLVDVLEDRQARHHGDHAPDLGLVLLDDDLTDTTEAQRTQRLALALVAPDLRADLRDLQSRHVSSPPLPRRPRRGPPHEPSASPPGRRAQAAGRGEPRSPPDA